MEPITPQFNSKPLQDAFKQASVHIDGYFLNLDAVSEDIKSLEAYLSKSGVRHEVVHFIDAAGNVGYGISWGEDPKSGRWRLMSFSVGPDADGVNEVGEFVIKNEKRPLIECPAQDRLHLYPHLAGLLKQVGESVMLQERLTIPKP